jgi:NADH-quinone oxidoreductase subunit N
VSKELMERIFNADAATATAPLLTLTAGVVLLLLIEVLPGLARARPFVFVGALLGAGWGLLAIHAAPPGEGGLVLDGTYLADRHSAAWGVIFLSSTLIAWIYARRYYKASHAFLGEHDILLLTAPIGMLLMAGAQDLVVFFIGLELLSVPLYCLAAFRRARNDSIEAGLKYFVLGAFGVAIFLYGAALLYTATGSLSLVELRTAGDALSSPLALTGVALMVASLFFKISVFPFHLWVPDVYQGSPTPVTALMATGTKAAAFAFLLSATFLVPPSAATLIGGVAVVTLAVGNLCALVQEDVKRMLAYSGIAHAGTVLLAVAGAVAADGALDDRAVQAALFYMAAYVFTAGGAFGVLSWLEADGEHFTRLASLKGLARRRPGVAAALTLFMLSLGGIPATGGFLGKWFVFAVAIEGGLVKLSLLGILMSVVALGYYLRVIVAMYMEREPEGQAPPMTQRAHATFATGFCAAMVVLLGVLPGVFLDSLFG